MVGTLYSLRCHSCVAFATASATQEQDIPFLTQNPITAVWCWQQRSGPQFFSRNFLSKQLKIRTPFIALGGFDMQVKSKPRPVAFDAVATGATLDSCQIRLHTSLQQAFHVYS